MRAIVGTAAAVAIGVAGVTAAQKWGPGGEDHTTRDETGQIVSDGKIGAFVLRVGDCLNLSRTSGEISTTDGVPCTSEHNAEVLAEYETQISDFDESAIEKEAEEKCMNLILADRAIDISKIDQGLNDYSLPTLTPSSESFAEGDREITCLVKFDLPISQSVRG